jgi:hypothetical protein
MAWISSSSRCALLWFFNSASSVPLQIIVKALILQQYHNESFSFLPEQAK